MKLYKLYKLSVNFVNTKIDEKKDVKKLIVTLLLIFLLIFIHEMGFTQALFEFCFLKLLL